MSVCMESNLYVKELQSSPTAYPNMTLESNIGHFQDGDRSRIGFEMGNKLSNDSGDRDTGDRCFIDESIISKENDVDKKKNNQSNGISANHLQNGDCYHGDKVDVIDQNEENSSENWSVISVNSDGNMIDRENLTSADSGCENEITEQYYDPDDEVTSDCFHSNNNTILRKSCQNDGKFIISRTPENLEVIDEEMELTSNTDVTGSNSADCDICRTNIIQGSMSDDGNVDPYDLSDGERLKEDEEFVIQLNSYKSYNDLSRLGIEDCLCSDKPDVFTNNNQMNGANEGSCNSCSQDGRNSRFSSISENDLEEENPTEGSTEKTLHMCSENKIEESSVHQNDSVELDIYSHGQGCLCSECSAFTSLSSSQLDINQFKEYCEQAENEEDVFVSQSDLRSKVGRSRTFHGTDEYINHEQMKNLYVSADDQFIQYGAKEVSVQSSSFTTSEHGSIENAKSQLTHSGQLSPQFSTRESGFYDGEVENHEILIDEIEEEALAGNDNKSEDIISQQDIEIEEEEYENQEVLTEDNVTQTSCNVIHTSSNVRWEDDVMCTCEECLRGLRIERIVTEDKATMCPEEPPYVLMCEICEELLENQLQKTEKDSKKKEETLKREIKELKRDNDAHQKVIQENLQLGPEAKIEATMQHEITRLTSENLDLRESKDKKDDQIRKLKKMLKVYAKRLKDGEAAEIAAELEKEDKQASVDNMASVKHRERSYMGMLEYRKDDETVLIKNLIMDLKPKVASGLLPGLPAYVLFMCVRHTDYINDDEKVRSLLTNTINGIKKCVKKHNTELDRVTLWLANTCRLLHTLKQYSGEKAFQSENTSRQNEHCLRNFDLSEYRQVFSDLAVWIYQSMIKHMEETLQPMVVPAVLEHEAIAGLSASKPSGMRGRSSSSHSDDIKELSLDSLMKALNKYIQVLSQHAVDPELVKQIFRQIYHFICAGALNNLLLRKDMCNWSKGMQIRYNLSHLEQWLRDNKLQESGAQETLEPVIQASQLLQARKSVADVDSICEMCSKLTTPQIVKILNLYTPVDEFEEKVPVSFIRKIQEKLKSRQGESDNTLLMDTKYAFPVTFPFNPSSVALDSIDIPQALHVGFLVRV